MILWRQLYKKSSRIKGFCIHDYDKQISYYVYQNTPYEWSEKNGNNHMIRL